VGVRKVGLEEELLLVDPATGHLVAVSSRALRAHERRDQHSPEGLVLEKELFAQQIETATPPSTDLAQVTRALRESRRLVAAAAVAAGARAVAVSTPPLGDESAQVSPDERYGRLLAEFRAVARSALACGMHVHVDVEGDEEAVAVVDRLRPWLPLLLAVSANSPLWRGTDTGYASWRSQVWGRWPSAGQTEPFADPAGYRTAAQALIASGAAIDEAQLYWDVRLAAELPTVEVRVADVCTDVADTILVAALARALVETTAREWAADEPLAPWRTDLLRAAHWRAARDGVDGLLVHPVSAELVPAPEALDAVVAYTREALDHAGDLDLVADGLERVQRSGGGAGAQRRTLVEHGSYEAVVADLVERTARV
jgi:carboxylate-amine ligase